MDLIKELKKSHWQRHQDLIIFSKPKINFHLLSDEILDEICLQFKCKRIAVLDKINIDNYRSPKITLIKGDSPLVLHIDNHIKYFFDLTQNMFSFGNINEKLRISKMNCSNEIIFDMFAGIGYFTLPFLVHAKAEFVHACDLNPEALKYLKENLKLNKVEDKCKLYLGNCCQVNLINIADKVYLGLIPSCQFAWKSACEALKKEKGGIIYIHENVNTFSLKPKSSLEKREIWKKRGDEIKSELMSIFSQIYNSQWFIEIKEITKVKSYAPHIDHLVFDVHCVPMFKKLN